MFVFNYFFLLAVVKAERFQIIDDLLSQVKNYTKGDEGITINTLSVSTEKDDYNYEKIIIKDTESKLNIFTKFLNIN